MLRKKQKTNQTQREEAIVNLINDEAITFSSETQKIMSPTGKVQNWLIDLRPVLLNVEALHLITDWFWDHFENQLPFQIGGMEVAAVPLVTALLMRAKERGIKTSGFIIRKERKTSGLGKIIEGPVNDNPIILVDDIMNSGASVEKARAALIQAGKKIDQVFVVLDYENARGKEWKKQHQINVTSISNLDPLKVDLIETNYKPQTIHYDILWRYVEPGAYPFHIVPKSTPFVVKDQIFMGTESGKMICLNRTTGEVMWKFDTKTHHPKGIWSSPAYYKGQIFFGAYNGILYCLDAHNGEEIWRNPCCEFIGSSPLIVPQHGLIYVGLEHQRPRQMGSNAAFNIKNGSRVWECAQRKYQHGSAAYYAPKNLVIFGNADHDITAYDALTGQTIWKYETERSIKYPPSIDTDQKLAVATSFDGNIYILDAETGQHKAAIQTNDICYTTALITHDKIFAGSGDRHMYIIDTNNYELIKKIDCHARVYSSPKLIDERVVFGTGGGRIIELNPNTLEIEEQVQLPDAITNAISASPQADILYASTCMNEIYALKRKKL